jgi:hypothetical protein
MLSVEQTGGFAMTADNSIFIKGGGIHTDWVALYSGSVSLAVPIISDARTDLAGGPKSLAEVVNVFTNAYKKHLAQHVAAEVLSPGFDADSFYRDGLAELGEMGFTEKRRDFEYRMQNDPAMEFLVYGFDGDGRAHIFTVRNPGAVTYHDNEAFWAIGSGQQVAITALMFHQYNLAFPMAWSIYHVCEAKFMAEQAPGVGKETFILVVNKKAGFTWYPVKEIHTVREAWEKYGRPSRPPQGITAIQGLIDKHRELLKQGGNALGVMPSISQKSKPGQ